MAHHQRHDGGVNGGSNNKHQSGVAKKTWRARSGHRSMAKKSGNNQQSGQ